ncbi:MAG: lamin tail domain-containing protein [Roseibacillus sp.]
MNVRLAFLFSYLCICFSQALASVVINELHIDEDDKTKQAEFIELYNSGTVAVDVSGWSFSSGVDYTFPAGSRIEAGGYLVVAWNPTMLSAEFGYADALGPWEGKLSNQGESVVLRDGGGVKVDEVSYQLGFPWPTVGDEPSPSMELIHPLLDNDLGGNWRSAGNLEGSSLPAANYVLRNDSGWSYREGTSFPNNDLSGKNWTENGYDESDDGNWAVSQAPFGFGDGDDNTVLAGMEGNYISFFMRHEFTIAAGEVPDELTLRALYDDGLAVHINGVEVERFSLMSGAISFPPPAGFALQHEANDYEEVTIAGATSYLVEGTNTITVQLINRNLGSTDATADVELVFLGAASGGTALEPSPGAVNSVFAGNAPPSIRQVSHTPERPTSSDEVTITAKVTDPEGVSFVELDYQLVAPGDYITIDDPRYGTNWTTLAMADAGTQGDLIAGDSTYSVVLPATLQSHRDLVRYRIRAEDGNGTSVLVPYADDPTPNFAYFVYDQLPTWTGQATPTDPNVSFDFNNLPDGQQKVAVYQLITTRDEHVNAQYIPGSTRGSGYTGSDYLWKGCLIYEGEVYDHIRFRARGGVHRYRMGKNMWKFDFNRGHRFQARDDYGEEYETEWSKLNFSAIIQQGNFNQRGEQGLYESVGFELFDLAGSEASNTHYVHFRIIEDADEEGPTNSQFDNDFQGLYLAIEQMDGQYLEEHDLPDGNLYKMESGTGISNNQGPNQPSDRSDLDDFLGTYEGGTQTEQWWRDNLDLSRYYAYRTIVEGIRHYDIHAGKNYFYFNNPESDQWEVHAWDLDVAWSDGGFGTGNEPFKSRVLAIPALAQEYRNEARSLLDLLFNSEQTDLLIDERMQFVWTDGFPSYVDADRAMWDYNPILVSSFVSLNQAGHGEFYKLSATTPDSFEGMAQKMRNYIVTRRAWIEQNVLTDSAQVPHRPVLSYEGTSGFPANEIAVASSGFSSPVGSSFAGMEYRLAEVTDETSVAFDPMEPRKYEAECDWESGTLTAFTETMEIPATEVRPGRDYRVRVRHLDSVGRWSRWSEPMQFVAGESDVSGYQNQLVITEFMFNPPAPQGAELLVSTENDDYEWIEVTNVGETALDLTNVRFTKGVDFDFPSGTLLAAGASIVIVKNEAAFTARYGPGISIAGNYGGDQLSNGGELLKLSLGAGVAIHEFTYEDGAPWPEGADGDGKSVVLVNPSAAPDHSLPANWRASFDDFGTPGSFQANSYQVWLAAHGISDGQGDEDGDGIVNLLEFFLNGDLDADSTAVLPVGLVEPLTVDSSISSYLTISFERRADVEGLSYQVQYSPDLVEWDEEGAVLHSSTPNGEGMIAEVWRFPVPVSANSKYFARLEVEEDE